MTEEPTQGAEGTSSGCQGSSGRRGSSGRSPANPLAAVVEKPRSEASIESLRSEGVYDDDRRIREYGPDTVALPVTAPPAETRVLEVIRQVDPVYRSRDLSDHLRERGWSEDEIARAPGSWAVIGSVILVRVPEECPDERTVAEALLDVHGEAETVLADEGIAIEGAAGTHREPRTRHLLGPRDTRTVHVEDGIRYGLDPSRVMFSPGNQAERRRMGEVVEAGERVFDMFAGVGYFALPMAAAGARVSAVEINPTAFRYLLENAVENDVSERLDAYRSDCRELAEGIEADRAVMGYYGRPSDDGTAEIDRIDEAHEFLPAALASLAPSGTLHYHEATPESRLWERPLERIDRALSKTGREWSVLGRRRVKSHSAGVSHVVLDVEVT